MYIFVVFSSQIPAWRGSLVPQTRGSHTPIWLHGRGPLSHKTRGLIHKQRGLIHQQGVIGRDLKIDYY
jgi:hypothetical protein